MSFLIRFLAFNLFLLFVSALIATEEQKGITSLEDARTLNEVSIYFGHKMNELQELDPSVFTPKEVAALKAALFMSVSDKRLRIIETLNAYQRAPAKQNAYRMKLYAILWKIDAGIDGAEQELKMFLNELTKNEETKSLVDEFRLRISMRKMAKTESTPEMIDAFKAELMSSINMKTVNISTVASLAFAAAQHNKIPAEQFCKELTEFIESSKCTLLDKEKIETIVFLDKACMLAFGSNPKLYGRMSDGKDLNWESLRGKYVLISFTTTENDYHEEELFDMLKIYKKYHDKGLEIVSIYGVQGLACDVKLQYYINEFKKSVEENQLPWIVVSEALTAEAGLPVWPREGRSRYFGRIYQNALVDKEGKIIMAPAGGKPLRDKLAEIFE